MLILTTLLGRRGPQDHSVRGDARRRQELAAGGYKARRAAQLLRQALGLGALEPARSPA